MVIDEKSRHQPHSKLEVVLGEDEAATMMAYLSPFDRAEVATKSDLQSLRNELLAAFRAETRTMVLSMMAFFTALSAVLVAALRLT